jgi:hypothetical protein
MMARPGRPESDLDPEAGPEAQFGFALRRLRESVGSPPYRKLAARPGVYFSASVLSQTANGEKIPKEAHVRAYVIACVGADCRGALEYWERQRQRYDAESKAQSRNRGTRGDTVVPVSADGWLRRLLAMLGTVSLGAVAIFLIADSAVPPATQRELAAGCDPAEMGTVSVWIPPGRQDGSLDDDRYQTRQRQAQILKQVGCVVGVNERSPSSGAGTEALLVRGQNV